MVSPMGWLRLAGRAPLLASLLAAGLFTVVVVFPALGRDTRERVVARWSRLLLGACGVRLREHPAEGAESLAARRGGHMLLANHVSWLDVFLVLAIAPAHFVAKAEIARWPLLGTLVSRVGTLFIERGKRHAVHRMNRRIAQALGEGRRVAVFAEGTTSDGTRLLPFHGNLVEAALHARAPVVPVGLRYLDGEHRPTDAAVFIGSMAFVTSLYRVLTASSIVAEVHPLPPAEGETRQRIAEQSRRAIGARLGLPLDEAVPEAVRRARRPGSGG
ncbi:MAG: lysophospholipid acyltransferase family protein [Burkholderiaceae bacterium]